jgi:hypothetical protein
MTSKSKAAPKRVAEVAAFAALLALPAVALACSCVRNVPLETRIQYADIILIAEVTKVEPLQRIVVRPIEIIKGRTSKPVIISTGSSDCDYFLHSPPHVGERYLLFLTLRQSELNANRCYLPGRIADKAQELEALRKHFATQRP